MEIIEQLQWLNQRRKLALFVGAGVSTSCGLPGWGTLLADLAYRTFGLEEIDDFLVGNSLRIARVLLKETGDRFENLVEEALYSYKISYSDLILSIPDSGINRICNFNFDHLLDSAFKICGVKHDLCLSGDQYDQHQLRPIIFHPHGFLDYSTESTRIVFSEQEYHKLYSDPYCWANLVQINLLMNYSVLFVGVSLTDPNLRRLVDSASKLTTHPHFAIFKEKESAVYTTSMENDLKSLGIKPVWVSDYGNIADIFIKIRRVYESKRRRKARLAQNLTPVNQRKKKKRVKRMLGKVSPNNYFKPTS